MGHPVPCARHRRRSATELPADFLGCLSHLPHLPLVRTTLPCLPRPRRVPYRSRPKGPPPAPFDDRKLLRLPPGGRGPAMGSRRGHLYFTPGQPMFTSGGQPFPTTWRRVHAAQRRADGRNGTLDGRATPPRRRQVLVLIKCMGHGGAERLVVSMMRHRDRERFDYEVAYVLEDRDTLVPQLREAGVAVHSLGARGNQDLRWMWTPTRPARRGRLRHHALAPSVRGDLRPARGVGLTLRVGPALVYTEHSMWDKMALAVKALEQGDHRPGRPLLVVSEACRQVSAAGLSDIAHGWWCTGSSSSRSARPCATRGELREAVRAGARSGRRRAPRH